MKNRLAAVALLLTMLFVFEGCQKNYYTGSSKKSNCGCPSQKGW